MKWNRTEQNRTEQNRTEQTSARPLKQRIKRVLLSALGISALAGIIGGLMMIPYFLIFSNKTHQQVFDYIISTRDNMFLFMVAVFIFTLIPNTVFAIFLEKVIDKTYTTTLNIYALIVGILSACIVHMIFAPSSQTYSSFGEYMSLCVLAFYIPCIIATLIITQILKAKSKNTFQAA